MCQEAFVESKCSGRQCLTVPSVRILGVVSGQRGPRGMEGRAQKTAL